MALCQRRQPPKAGAVGQRLQRATGQPILGIIKNKGWCTRRRRQYPLNGVCEFVGKKLRIRTGANTMQTITRQMAVVLGISLDPR